MIYDWMYLWIHPIVKQYDRLIIAIIGGLVIWFKVPNGIIHSPTKNGPMNKKGCISYLFKLQ